MKKLILLTIICTLISGCGLFRKKTKQVEESKIEQTSDVRVKAELDYSYNSKSAEVNTSFQREFIIGEYNVSADSIIFNSDGSFKAKGNAKMSGKHLNAKESNDSTSMVVDKGIKLQSKSDSTEKKKDKQEDKSVINKSSPSLKGVVFTVIIILMVVYFIIFKIKRKKIL